jgi:hypothetical protein
MESRMMRKYHIRFGEGLREKQVKLLALSLLYSSRANPLTGASLITN